MNNNSSTIMLDDTEEEIKNGTAKYLTHEEVFSKARGIKNKEKLKKGLTEVEKCCKI